MTAYSRFKCWIKFYLKSGAAQRIPGSPFPSGLHVCFFSCLCVLAANTPKFRPFLGTWIAFLLNVHLFIELKMQQPQWDFKASEGAVILKIYTCAYTHLNINGILCSVNLFEWSTWNSDYICQSLHSVKMRMTFTSSKNYFKPWSYILYFHCNMSLIKHHNRFYSY